MIEDGFHDEIITEGNKGQWRTVQEEEEAKSEGFGLFQKRCLNLNSCIQIIPMILYLLISSKVIE